MQYNIYEEVVCMSKKYYYEDKDFKLIQGDSLKILKGIEPKSIDMIFADPPYFLSSLAEANPGYNLLEGYLRDL